MILLYSEADIGHGTVYSILINSECFFYFFFLNLKASRGKSVWGVEGDSTIFNVRFKK